MRPRIRSVKPEMRQDERYARLSYPARELFNGLITMADDEGRFRALASAIKGHVFPYDEDRVPDFASQIRGWVAEVKKSGMIVFYKDDSVPYGAFRHWAKHQVINRPTPSDLPPPPSTEIVRENALVRTEKGWKQLERLSEDVRKAHGDLTDNSLRSQSPRAGARSDPFLSSVVQLSERLAACVRANDPKADPDPHSDRWVTDMRLLLKDRHGDVEEVQRIIDWCQADSFWRSNILSPGKLRRQFTQLLLKADQPNVVPMGRKSNAERMWDALGPPKVAVVEGTVIEEESA